MYCSNTVRFKNLSGLFAWHLFHVLYKYYGMMLRKHQTWFHHFADSDTIHKTDSKIINIYVNAY